MCRCLSQVANGIGAAVRADPHAACLTNDRELMGDQVNSRAFNIVAWVTVVVMIVLTIGLGDHAPVGSDVAV